MISSRSVLSVVLEFLGDFLFEGLNNRLSRAGKAILVASNKMVFSISDFEKVLPDLR